MNLKKEYEIISSEVENFLIDYEGKLNEFDLYMGTQILFSQLIHKPKFMFIGINPGQGYFKENGVKVREFGAQKEFEYLDNTYKLATETKDIFSRAGCTTYLETAVKTNWIFFATKNAKDLNSLLSNMRNRHKITLEPIFDSWVKRIIELIQPKIIICEGKAAFDRVTWNILPEARTVWGDGLGYIKTYDGIHILGYKRIFSNIKDKDLVANKIKEILQQDLV